MLESRKNPGARQSIRYRPGATFMLSTMLLLSCRETLADGIPDVTINAVLTGSGLGNQLSGKDLAAETIRIKPGHLRVDFDAGQGRRGRILRNGDGHAWLFMSTSNRALPADHVAIADMSRLDPARPCWALNLSCERVDDRLVAGRVVHGWRYRHAGQGGPGGTDRGTFWIDAEYGFVLSYKGEDLAGGTRRMETTAVAFTPLPDDEFAVPESIRSDVRSADARASSLLGGN